MAIPVLGCPVLNRGDLLLRMLRSIDYPINKIVIINNGNDLGIQAVLEQIEEESEYNLRIHNPGYNIGVASSWNWICKKNPAEYWLLAGNDIQFTPGDLRKIDLFVSTYYDYVMYPANWGHSLFAIRQSCFDGAGYFDQNFFPAYGEDQDHCYRIKLAGLKWTDVPNVHAVHGEPPLWGSSTVWSDPVLNRKCAITQQNNAEYFRRKWGGEPGKEKFIHPYDNPDLSIKEWIIDKDLAIANENPIIQYQTDEITN